jgi:hypothetical protein
MAVSMAIFFMMEFFVLIFRSITIAEFDAIVPDDSFPSQRDSNKSQDSKDQQSHPRGLGFSFDNTGY